MTTQFNQVESEEGLFGLGYSFDKKNFSFSSINKSKKFNDSNGSLLHISFGIDPSMISY